MVLDIPRSATVVILACMLPAAAWPQQPSASGAACDWPESREFDFWIGEWEVLNRHRAQGQDDPTWYQTGMATDRVFAAVGGCATVERWYGKLSFDEIVGFSVRPAETGRCSARSKVGFDITAVSSSPKGPTHRAERC